MKKRTIERMDKAQVIANQRRAINEIAELEEKVNDGYELSYFGEFTLKRNKEIVNTYEDKVKYMEAANKDYIYVLGNIRRSVIVPYEIGDALWNL